MGGPDDAGAVRDLVVRVGTGMNESFDSVSSIESTLTEIFVAQGIDDAKVIVFPTAVEVQTGDGAQSGVQLSSRVGSSLRYDQIAALYALIDTLKHGPVDPKAANEELDRITAMPAKFPWLVRVLGYGLFAVGFALMLL